MITICDIHDPILREEKEKFIAEIVTGLYDTWKKHVDWPLSKWREIILHRLQETSKKFPFTIVAYEEERGRKNFLGSLSIEQGCPEVNDQVHLWLCGWYVKPEKRHAGYALKIAQSMLEKLDSLGVQVVCLYTVIPELDQLYEQYGFVAKGHIQVEGYPANVREGVVKEVLDKLHQRSTQTTKVSAPYA